ncbi:adaptor protein MecA [Oceanobacillus caeni]|uniref:adaptor protein MecA n=1 Tax=Oceanobacillus caeni TaxID=405946 RepID=UPI00195D8A63|nr:adaptor protein MecA [Oceanobacillus caeni]MBU8790761.1 adaptor protein MecA [Oceanobacillus caeni]MCR1835472.1 adaptor protein MecA [Oceanobacillus caeni]
MDIERINENTVKFYISYLDIEDLGFEREEIWYDRERSEQLFWQMMDEVNYKEEDFNIDGPLWIQVQALEKGLEIIVTKAKIGSNGELQADGMLDGHLEDKLENFLEDKFGKNLGQDDEEEIDLIEDGMWIIAEFDNFEDAIQLSHYFQDDTDSVEETVYSYHNKYYLYLEFSPDLLDDHLQEDLISQVLEFANDSDMSIHVLEEYGKKLFEYNAFEQIRSYFPAQV